jgi:uncharacterized protein (TIGR03000 family)
VFHPGFHDGFPHGGFFHGGFFGSGFYGYYPGYWYSYGYPYDYGYSSTYVYPSTTYVVPQTYVYPDYSDYTPPAPLDGATSVPPVTVPSTASAVVTVVVPDNAEVWFNDTRTRSTGPVRTFDTPPLGPGRQYSYDVKASWQENGRTVTQTQDVAVSPGARVTVRFPIQESVTTQPMPPLNR